MNVNHSSRSQEGEKEWDDDLERSSGNGSREKKKL